jgi:hypothetical protein
MVFFWAARARNRKNHARTLGPGHGILVPCSPGYCGLQGFRPAIASVDNVDNMTQFTFLDCNM